MLFSTTFGISPSTADDWFDPILPEDTRLFIDPLLVRNSARAPFKGVNSKLMGFFKAAFKLAAESEEKRTDTRYILLKGMMRFPEVKELCLGYSSSTSGAGSGDGYGAGIVSAIYRSIEMGITSLVNFETLGLFNEGIGKDRISDITASIIKEELIQYTQDVCKKYSIPVKPHSIRNAFFDYENLRWRGKTYDLPANPYFTNTGIILVPSKFLVEDQNLSANNFKDFIWENQNEEIRSQFSYQIKRELDKEAIIRIAKTNRKWVKDFEDFIQRGGFTAYDLKNDRLGIYTTVREGIKFVSSNPHTLGAKNDSEFQKCVSLMLSEYARFLEHQNGYKLLWNDNGKEKREEAAQIMMTSIVTSYCKANNIDVSREANIGKGPVDFKFSQGYKSRTVIELKKAHNPEFWDGLSKQLPQYLKSEDIDLGYFVALCYSPKDLLKVKDLAQEADKVSKAENKLIIPVIIDVTNNKPSASNL